PSRFMLLPSIPSLSCLIPPPPLPTLFPYTTLFRSPLQHRAGREAEPSPRRHGGRAGERMPRADSLVFPAAPPAENVAVSVCTEGDRKSTRLNSSHVKISYAVFCLKKKNALTKSTKP